MWRHRVLLTLVYVTVCCLKSASHYLSMHFPITSDTCDINLRVILLKMFTISTIRICFKIASSKLRTVKSLKGYVDGLMQEGRNSISNALELRLFCTKPSRYMYVPHALWSYWYIDSCFRTAWESMLYCHKRTRIPSLFVVYLWLLFSKLGL